jgi:hypothetical protein
VKLRANWLLVCCTLVANPAFAREAPPPLELLEVLGELGEEDMDDLDMVLAEVEVRKIKPPPRPKEVKDGDRN